MLQDQLRCGISSKDQELPQYQYSEYWLVQRVLIGWLLQRFVSRLDLQQILKEIELLLTFIIDWSWAGLCIHIDTCWSLIGLFCVVFKPIFASAKMCINPNAELELKAPKANLHLEVQNIAIEMTKPQVMWLTVRWYHIL